MQIFTSLLLSTILATATAQPVASTPGTITNAPHAVPTATFTLTAQITTYTEAAAGHGPGDVGITIDPELAKQLDDSLTDHPGDCLGGQRFATHHPHQRLTGLSGTICGLESTIANIALAAGVIPVLGAQPPPRIIRGDAERALAATKSFAGRHATALNVSPDGAGRLAEFLFPLVWLKVVEGRRVQGVNLVEASLVDSS
ncbi:hypothetical protein P168DRAFT_302942 [Aspergillus campestris IBT 28561]|uniref:Uncharacterized protein n=1 Tax=Aspergillus campestris (strain IBT 28561) TaxID=1392248 RepID=A0A2I1D9V2_ASPC2|nr:uncharacterized protein P168DRAFT_302942 [Aspergillus campestris IBT 28561]PKY06642.1 hypothetical protein P168DRAFT_302942 [Aspergillus campestris IBT 28561]